MKKASLLLIVVFLPLTSSLSQDFPIPAEGAQWNNAESQGTTYYANRIECAGDTVINAILYSKLVQTWKAVYYQTGTCDFAYLSGGPKQVNRYSGAIRTDETQKVYYIHPGEDTCRLIYDFSVKSGDSIRIDGYESPYYAHIQQVDTILINGTQRKRVILQGIYGFYDEWIEGIGSLEGLFATFMKPWEKYSTELTCYQEYGLQLFPTSQGCTRCNTVTEIKGDIIRSRISIYPNPIVNTSNIEWPKTLNAQELVIYDLSGRVILQKNVVGLDNYSINSQELAKGVLLLTIVDKDHHSYRNRIIVN